MKKTQIIELFKTINKTKVSFLSIAFFVMLGTTGYLGVSWAVQGFTNTIENTLNNFKFQDLEIKYPYGLNDEFINSLAKEDDSFSIEGEYSCYEYFRHDNSLVQAKVTSLTNNVNVIDVLEGTLPKTNKECAIEKFYAESNGIEIGDTIEFIHNDDGTAYLLKCIMENDYDTLKEDRKVSEDGMSYLTNDRFTITALVDSPEHLGRYSSQLGFSKNEAPINVVIYVTRDTFDTETMLGYTKVLLTSDSLRENKYNTNEYLTENEALIDRVQVFTNEKTDIISKQILDNKESIRKRIYDEIIDGEKQIEDAKVEIANGEKEISNAKRKLKDAKKQLENGEKEVADGWYTYNKGLNQYKDSENKLTTIQKTYDVVYEIIEVYQFVDANRENIDNTITEIKGIYDLLSSEIKTNLPGTKFIVDGFFDLINSNLDNIADYIEKYNELVSNPDFPTEDEIATEFDNLLASLNEEKTLLEGQLLEEQSKEIPDQTIIDNLQAKINSISDKISKLQNLKDKIISLYEDIDVYKTLPSDILNLYNILYRFGLLEGVKQELIDEINQELANRGIDKTLEQIIESINNGVNRTYNTYEELKPIINNAFDILSPNIDSIQNVMVTNIKPLLEDAWSELAAARAELNSALAQLYKAEEDIANGWAEYRKGINSLTEIQTKIEEAKPALADAEIELEKGKDAYQQYVDEVIAIEKYDATIIGRQSNYSIISTDLAADIISKIKYTMGALFVIVGAFVSYTSISRLVYNQTIEIGTKKALGLKQSEITISFIIYALLATIVGSGLGILLSRFIIEPIIVSILADSYNLHTFDYYFGLREYSIFTLFEIVITVIAAFLAAHKILKRKAIKLLAGKEQVLGKQRFYEKSALWNKLSLLNKTIINNCFNDARRVLSTIVGIAGCTSLLVCAIAFKNNVDLSIARQVNELANFDTYVYINNNDTIEKNISLELDKLGIEHVSALCKPGLLKAKDGGYVGTSLYASSSEELYEYRHQICDGKEMKPTNGIIVSKAFAKWNDVEIGDSITYIDYSGNEHTFAVEGISENYLLSIDTYISEQTFKEEFEDEIQNNVMFLRRNDMSIDDVEKAICDYDGYLSITDYQTNVGESTRAVTSTAFIIFAIFLVLSILLAFLVILNLLVVFVDEKKKETIVLMINGYKKKYAKKYIYTDTIFLTIISIIIGSVFGSIVGISTTQSLDTSSSTYMVQFVPQTYILAALITLVLCFIDSLIALRKIDKYKLTEINSK